MRNLLNKIQLIIVLVVFALVLVPKSQFAQDKKSQALDQNISILLYADDIVLISNTTDSMNKMLEVVHEYCCNWRLNINYSKSK